MNVQLLVVPGCANEAAARDLLTRALSDLGLADVNVGTRMVGSPELAAELRFVGSPTFLINGLDPFGEPDRVPGLTCRVYRGPDGALSGLPEIRELRKALRQAAAQAEDARTLPSRPA